MDFQEEIFELEVHELIQEKGNYQIDERGRGYYYYCAPWVTVMATLERTIANNLLKYDPQVYVKGPRGWIAIQSVSVFHLGILQSVEFRYYPEKKDDFDFDISI